MNINVELENSGIEKSEIEGRRGEAQEALSKLWSGELDFTGWVNNPNEVSDEQIEALTKTAADIRSKCDYFLVLGVGGSFMGAKAVIDILVPEDADTEVFFAGYNYSARYINELIAKIGDKDLCLCVVSKSGTTTETLSAYGIFEKLMIDK